MPYTISFTQEKEKKKKKTLHMRNSSCPQEANIMMTINSERGAISST